MPLCQVNYRSLETERTILLFTWSKWVSEEIIVSTVRSEYSAQQLLQMNFPAWQAQTAEFPASSHIIKSLRNDEKKCVDSIPKLGSNKMLTDELFLFPCFEVGIRLGTGFRRIGRGDSLYDLTLSSGGNLQGLSLTRTAVLLFYDKKKYHLIQQNEF